MLITSVHIYVFESSRVKETEKQGLIYGVMKII